ncbi:hypothetical protein [Sphingopyxis panaciterrae]
MATTGEKAAARKKSALSALVGGLVGAAGISALFTLAGPELLKAMGPSRLALAGIGAIYALIAAFLGFGLLAPRTGAKLLNVGDADELRDERSSLSLSASFMGAFGIALILLALARGPGFTAGVVAPGAAMAVLTAVLVVGIAATWRWRGRMDELNHQLGLEGGAWAFGLSALLLTVWGAAASVGWAVLTAIDVIAVLAAMMLLGSFVAIGLRGMMAR